MPPDGFRFPATPPVEALEYFRAKGLRVGFSYTDVWKEEHNAAFTAAKIMERDVLEDMRAIVIGALEEGVPFREFAAAATMALDRSGWTEYHKGVGKLSRIKTIYDTNMRTARAVGQWQRIERTKELLPFLQYNLGPSERHRPQHASWAGTILPIDDPWWDDHFTPNGWGCKCHIRQLGNREATRLGGVTERPPSFDVPWQNKSTGAIEQVPVGVDPAFAYNAGKDRMRGLREAESRR